MRTLRLGVPLAGGVAALFAVQQRACADGILPYGPPSMRLDGLKPPVALAQNPKSTERLLAPPVRKRIAIYGGSFNPITNAHLNVASEILHSKLVDEVWITPCGKRPDKPGLRTSMIHRLVMCHLAVDTMFGSRFGVKVCDEEADKPCAMPSIVLMRTLAEKYPEADFSFACGADQITEVKSWTAPAEPGYWDDVPGAGEAFFNETSFLCIERPGTELAQPMEMPPKCQYVSEALKARGSTMIETALSSTEVPAPRPAIVPRGMPAALATTAIALRCATACVLLTTVSM